MMDEVGAPPKLYLCLDYQPRYVLPPPLFTKHLHHNAIYVSQEHIRTQLGSWRSYLKVLTLPAVRTPPSVVRGRSGGDPFFLHAWPPLFKLSPMVILPA